MTMKKLTAALAVCLGLMLVTSSLAIAATTTNPSVSVYLNNKKISFTTSSGTPFIDEANRTLIPLRIVLESFGATVTWLETEKIVVATKGDIEVRVPVGQRFIERNTEVIMIDTTAIIVGSRTYIPLRAVLEAFGCKVEWVAETKTVLITAPKDDAIISRLPVKYDLRTLSKVSPIRNQFDIGTCWAFATMGALESSLLPTKLYNFSEDHMSLTHGYNLGQDDGGDFQISLAYLARWSGPVLESEDPYGDGVASKTAKASVHVQEAIILPKKDYSAIKRAIMSYGGVQTSIHSRDIYEQELGDAYNPDTKSFYYSGTAKPNHDVVIVGWDDEYPIDKFNTKPSRPGAFICRNSYGTGFGDKGYFYVSYDDVLIGDESVVYSKIESKTNFDKIYQSDWLGWVGRIGYGKDTAYFSNVYTSSGQEALKAISFYATDMDTSYEVYVVPDFTETSDFKKKAFVTRGFLDYAGYYTIKFPKSIEVNGDFAVIVKVTTPDSLFPVAAEFYKDVRWLSEVDISDGRGYMSFDGSLWESTEDNLQSNVALKAFTSKVGQ